MKSSRIPGFYDLPIELRLEKLADSASLDPEEMKVFTSSGLTFNQADHMIENAIGIFGLPIGIGLNFIVNRREVVVPMAIEEPSVVAGASFMAKLARSGGGFIATSSAPEMIGQIQVLDVKDLEAARKGIEKNKKELLAEIDAIDPILKQNGGGARDLEIRIIENSPIGTFMVIHLIYNVKDAMGANAINTACEKIAPKVEKITSGRVHLRILSNLADRRLTTARCTILLEELAFKGVENRTFSAELVRDSIIEAWAFATADPYRAATHNKGIMNGVDAVAIATGNDWRAIEAGAHAYAARNGRYSSLSTWGKDAQGNLIGELEMPMVAGIIGGATKVHPVAKAAIKLMGVQTADENLAALRSLSTEGIQRGHMSLHARQVAIAAGAEGDQITAVANQMVKDNKVRIDHAEEILRKIK
jgi:hydroxymethylglutaryl-CoA reductase